jgi:predicted amino acid dehydrogenase
MATISIKDFRPEYVNTGYMLDTDTDALQLVNLWTATIAEAEKSMKQSVLKGAVISDQAQAKETSKKTGTQKVQTANPYLPMGPMGY